MRTVKVFAVQNETALWKYKWYVTTSDSPENAIIATRHGNVLSCVTTKKKAIQAAKRYGKSFAYSAFIVFGRSADAVVKLHVPIRKRLLKKRLKCTNANRL